MHEKYLKALLTKHKIYFPKVHDLIQLEELVVSASQEIRRFHGDLLTLNPYGIDIRYPGLKATMDEAKRALKAMKSLRRFMWLQLEISPA